ncbi:hypothetical protein ES703_118742 [subsurface metagenome]
MVEKRSLYQCFHAKVKGDYIYCAKGHHFVSSRKVGIRTLSIDRLVRGAPLVFSMCQGCIDYEPMGEPILAEERGWTRQGTRETKAGKCLFPSRVAPWL